jgi:hypothetical protein
MLTPKETGVGKRYRIPYAGIVTAVSSTQTLPTQATISLWYLDAGELVYAHVHIQKDGTIVTVTIGGTTVYNYTGTMGATFAALIKNILTKYFGEWVSAWADVFCVEGLVGVDAFSKETSGTFDVALVDKSKQAFTGGASSGTNYHANWPPFRAFDGVPPNGSNAPCYYYYVGDKLGYDFGAGNEKQIVSYTMYADGQYGSGSNYSPKSWTVSGSDDGSTWTLFDTVVNAPAMTWNDGIYHDMDSPPTRPYRHYRMWTNAIYADAVLIGEWEGHEFVKTMYNKRRPIEPKVTVFGDTGSHLDFADPENLGADVAHPKEAVAPVWVRGGTASASSTNGAFTPALAFNGNYTNPVSSDAWGAVDGATPYWLQYVWSTGKIITKYEATSRAYYAARQITAARFEGSNDGSTWDVLDDWSGSQSPVLTRSFTNTKAYTHYRFTIISTAGYNPMIHELRLFEYQPDASPNDWTITGTQTTTTPTS